MAKFRCILYQDKPTTTLIHIKKLGSLSSCNHLLTISLYSYELEEESVIRYKISQMTDTGSNVTLALSEDIELENVSQQQMMLEAIDRAIGDKEVKEQIKPILEAILRSQPQTVIKTYSQTIVQITMPKRRYEKIGSPRVGDRLLIDIKKVNMQSAQVS